MTPRTVHLKFVPNLSKPWGPPLLSVHCLSAFGEEIPIGQTPVPEDVKPEKNAISANEGYIDSSHAYVDRKINEDH